MAYGKGSGSQEYNLAYMGLDQLGCPGQPQLNGEVKDNAKKGAAIASTVTATATAVASGVVTTAVTSAASAVGISLSAAAAGSVVPVIGTAIGLVIGATVGLIIAKAGGASQTRFIDRTLEAYNAIKNAGYDGITDGFSKYKLRKTQVRDKVRSGDSYAKEYARLFKYIIDTLNQNNPGLGTYWGQNFPFSMANQGQIKEESMRRFKELIRMFPPGTYKGQQPFAMDDDGKVMKTIISTGRIVTDADGDKIIENVPRDTQGNVVLPQATIDEANKLEAKQAGGGTLLAVAGLAIFTTVFLRMANTKDNTGIKKAA